MKNEKAFREAAIEALDVSKKIDQKAANVAAATILKAAAEDDGPSPHVRARVDCDNNGVLFIFSRPTIHQRWTTFINCGVVKPVKKKSVDEKPMKMKSPTKK